MSATVVLFGACDRHNLGDLLFPHIAAALLPRHEVLIAGLAARDLRPCGGHRVEALHRLLAEGRLHGAHLVHVGGEILGCNARQAAVMLLPADELQSTLSYLEHQPHAERRWRRAMLGTASPMPYVVAREQLPGIGRIVFDAVGGVALGALPPRWRRAVLARLAGADAVSVRDATTLLQLRSAGIDAGLLPDPAVMVEALFGERIRARADHAPLAEVRAAFPQGYIAVQLAADFADDTTLAIAAAQLRQAIADSGLGVVLFRAGAAPWHDDPDMLARLAAQMDSPAVRLFRSLDIWDICALLAHARVQAGSSLHGHLVATAFGVPAVGLLRPDEAGRFGKLAAWAETWHAQGASAILPIERLAEGLHGALRGDAGPGQAQRAASVSRYREGFARLTRCLG
jgi:hypothetical protein